MITDELRAKDGFTAVERVVAGTLLEHQEGIRALSARAIAKEAHTAPSSVVRFCQRLGFVGYPEFREAWLDELRYLRSAFTDIDVNHPFSPGDDTHTVAGGVSAVYVETIHDTMGLLEGAELRRVAKAIDDAEHVVVFSSGVQAALATTFMDKMLRLGRVVTVQSQGDQAYYQARAMRKGDVLFVISYSGETVQGLRCAAAARRQGAHVVAITSFGHNRLIELATAVLRVSTRERLVEKVGDYAMNVSTLLLLDLVYSEVFQLAHEDNLRRRTVLGHDYERRRYSSNPILQDQLDDVRASSPGR
ncbi:MurR/RpiR family transcriptional regulator [Luteococcus sp. H138]|uniref:MurR/RpiR family transcriptional regulator n=1 Tax=unclassified Luteococcus TaxID=2639923 RepID=UPI00313EE7C4